MNDADLIYAQAFFEAYGVWPQSPPLGSWWRMDYRPDHPGANQDPDALAEVAALFEREPRSARWTFHL